MSLPVVIGAGSHPFPFRTRKLSLLPPMVLRGKLRGRVGRCRHYLTEKPASFGSRAFARTPRPRRPALHSQSIMPSPPEVWLRGPLLDFSPALRPVAHS